MKKIMWALSCVSLIGTVIALRFLPEKVPMHYDLAGNIDRWGSKYETLLFPVILLLLSLFWTLLTGYYEKKASATADEKESAAAHSNVKVLGIGAVSTTALLIVIQGVLLFGAFKAAASGAAVQAVKIGNITAVLMGIMMIVLGNFMTKTRANRAVGVRVSWSLYNDTTWRKSNRFGAFALMIAGVLTILLAVLLQSDLGALAATLGPVLLALIATLIYAHRVYVQEIEREKGENNRNGCNQ